MPARLALLLILVSLAGGQAFAQANIRPDTNPRLPPQAGQGLPVKDQEFITRAANLSDAEMQGGRLASEKATSAEVKAFGEKIVSDHQSYRQALADLARKNKVSVEPHASRAAWETELQRLRGLNGAEFEREFLNWQLQVHLSLADMYQTQASGTPETDLARFAIVTLKQIQDGFDRAKQLAARYNLAVETIKQPPQY